MVLYETILLLVLAVCIFTFISFFGAGGYLGALLSDFCFGVFGVMAYLFPPLLFLAVAFWISNFDNSLAGFKFGGCVLLYLSICCFAALIEGEYGGVYSAGKLYARCASLKQGGGVIGETICHFIVPAIGQIGAGIIFGAFILIALLLITQRSLIQGLRRQWKRLVRSVKAAVMRIRTEMKKRDDWDLDSDEEEDEPQQQPETEREEKEEEEKDDGLEGFSVLPKAERLPVTHRSGKTAQSDSSAQSAEKAGRIDVSLLYAQKASDAPRERVFASGVTSDTQITGDRTKVGADVHQILPQPGVPSYQEMSEESFPLHIEGMEEEEPEEFRIYREEPGMQVLHGAEEAADIPAEANLPNSVEPQSTAETSASLEGAHEEAAPESTGEGPASGSRARHNPRSSEQEIEEGIASVEAEAEQAAKQIRPRYVFPPLNLLHKGTTKVKRGQEAEIRETAAKLEQTLDSFGVHVKVTNVSCGPSVTRYELLPEQGVKVSKIVSLADDIKLNLAAADIRIEAPIPGKSAVGIEVPNAENRTVALRDLLESDEFVSHKSKLAFATGMDISGKIVVSDIAKMPHLLIAGATGSGKSVCINTLIMSILYKAKPDEVKLIMIDPKVVELSVYNGIPHLLIPVVTDPKKAAGALNWGVAEMTDRYAKFAEVGARDLDGYNQKIENMEVAEGEAKPEKMPRIVIIVDELADLMMVAPGEVEDSICRLAQLARAAGIHLVIATQRPSIDVITGLIKANMPSRIAFAVTSGVDSRTIIDMYGAEKLLGKGDMLFYPQGYQKPARVQGALSLMKRSRPWSIS